MAVGCVLLFLILSCSFYLTRADLHPIVVNLNDRNRHFVLLDYIVYRQYYGFVEIPIGHILQIYEGEGLIWESSGDDRECGIVLSDTDYLGVSLLQLLVVNGNNFRELYFERVNDKWQTVELGRYGYLFSSIGSRRRKITVDIGHEGHSDDYQVSSFDENGLDSLLYTPFYGRRISSVVDDNHVIWKRNDEDEEQVVELKAYKTNEIIDSIFIKVSSPYSRYTVTCKKVSNKWNCSEPDYEYLFEREGSGFIGNITNYTVILILTLVIFNHVD